MIFSQRLYNLGLTKKEFARRIGKRPETVIRWREAPPREIIMLLKCWASNPEALREGDGNEKQVVS